MHLQYVKGSYLDEIEWNDRPVLFILEGLAAGQEREARQYIRDIWQWILAHRQQVLAYAPALVEMKNTKWLSAGEPKVSLQEVEYCLQHITSVHATYAHGFDIFFNTCMLFGERALVVHMGKNYVFEGMRLA